VVVNEVSCCGFGERSSINKLRRVYIETETAVWHMVWEIANYCTVVPPEIDKSMAVVYNRSLRISGLRGCGHINTWLGGITKTNRHASQGGTPRHSSKKSMSRGLMSRLAAIVN
jgi:hypothetical protein